MRHLFLDTNVILDFLLSRQPFAREAGALFFIQSQGFVRFYASAFSMVTMHYVMRKAADEAAVRTDLQTLMTRVQFLAMDSQMLNAALSSPIADFEDSIQHEAACSEPAVQAIVTRNGKDFVASHLPVLTPLQALTLFIRP